MVAAPVGHKCPDCARQSPRARGFGKPEQYVKAAGFGLLATGVAVAVLQAVFGGFGWFTWILSGVAGYGIAEAVRRGADGNRAEPFRWLAFGLAVAAVGLAWIVAVPGGPDVAVRVVLRNPFRLVTFLAAIVGAYRSIG
jgi:hypothetical protein